LITDLLYYISILDGIIEQIQNYISISVLNM